MASSKTIIPKRQWLAALALAAIAFAIHTSSARPKTSLPQFDELEYLAVARNVVDRGSFSISPPGEMPVAKTDREPGYPLFLAGAILLDPALRNAPWRCFSAPTADCAGAYRAIRAGNSLFFALSGLICFVIAARLGFDGFDLRPVAVPLLLRGFRHATSRGFSATEPAAASAGALF